MEKEVTSKISNEENVTSENTLLSFSQIPEIKRKEFDSKIKEDYKNETKLLTNLFNYKIDEQSGKDIYLYGIDVNEISLKNIDNFKVKLIKKLSKNEKFKKILKEIFEEDNYLISGLVLYGIPKKNENEKNEYQYFMLINIEKDINNPNKLIYSIIKIEKDENNFNECEEKQMIIKIKLTKKYNFQDKSNIKKDIKSQYRTFLNILTGKILNELKYKKDSSTRKILYYKEKDVEKLKEQEFIYSKFYTFPALKAICDYYKGSNTYHTYLKLYPKLILTPNNTYQNYYDYLLEKNNNDEKIAQDIFIRDIKNRRGIKIYNNEIIKIEDVIFENPYNLYFETKKETISVGEYYLNTYEINLSNEKIPIAIRYVDNNGKLKEPIRLYFPCSQLKTVGNLYNLRINVRDFVKEPEKKYNEIIQIKNKLSKKFKENCIKSGLFKDMKGKLDNIKATAYVLKAPKILFSSDPKEVDVNGSFDLRNTIPVKKNDNKINKSEVFMFGLNQNQSEFLFNQLKEASKLLNITIEEPFVTDLNDCLELKRDELYDYFLKLFKDREKDKKMEIVFLFMDSFYKNKSIYKIFKQSLNDSNWKVPSQCILFDKKKFERSANLSQFTNILSQIWAKKGSELYKCDIGFLKHNIIIAYSTSFVVKDNKK